MKRRYLRWSLLPALLFACGMSLFATAQDPAEAAPAAETDAPVVAPAETPLLDIIQKFLDDDHWHYERIEDRTALRMAFKGDNGEWTVVIRTKEDSQRAIFYSLLSETVPADQRALAGEYLHRANFGLPIGCFELDYDDGEVRFRTSLDTEGAPLSAAQVKTYLYINVSTCDLYLGGLKRVLSGAVTPENAIREIEGDPVNP
ncbi:MAG TPA: YbjN domain-containing protein [Candidatus Hydrogenedentes bacterium]|nr:YbjN domain-containing protein [Candidatus Hydrogenedentota bacterium]HNT86805.1 YbjN domain-containing protein [Candidatus Hydrogenedentota bacterium]